MNYLDAYLEREDVRRAIERCKNSHAVQGVIVDLDDWWLRAWRWRERNPGASNGGPTPWRDHPEWDARDPIGSLDSQNLKWLPQWWEAYSKSRYLNGDDSPARLRVCIVQGEQPPEGLPELSDLRVNYVIEPRAVPSLAATPTTHLCPLVGGGGIGVGTSGPGTLGGLLRDPAGQHYGVTCAHVATLSAAVDHPAQADVAGPNLIGTVAHAQVPTAFPPGVGMTPANQAANANDLDAALVEIDSGVTSHLEVDTLGPIAGVFPSGSIYQWQSTTFAGRTSGIRTVEFRGKIVYYNVPNASGTGTICFRNLYEVQWIPTQATAGSPPVQAGDSGAWLCVSGGAGYEWAAMAVAWDPSMGFAVAASEIEAWWTGQGLSLSTI